VAIAFDQALARASNLGPRRALDAASARLARAEVGVGPFVRNPIVEIAPTLRFSPSEDLGPEGQLSIRFPLDVAGLGGARERMLRSAASELEARAAELALDAELEAARAWLGLWAVEAQQRAAEEDAGLARGLVTKLERARAVGEATAVDVLEAQAMVDEAELAIVALEGERHDRALGLARALAMPPSPLPSAAGPLPSVEVPGLAEHGAWPAEAPAVRRATRAAELANARVDEARAQSATDIAVGWSVVRDAPNGWTTGAIVSVSLPWFDRAQAATAELDTEARLELAQAELERERAAVSLAAELHEVDHTRELVELLERSWLPRHEALVATRTRLVDAGEGGVHELALARRALVASKRRLIDARAAHALARVRARRVFDAGSTKGSTPVRKAR
jgi:outer membrane protein TolC